MYFLFNFFIKIFLAYDLEKIYHGLKRIPNIKVFLRNEVPDRLHYTNNNRVGPIVLYADPGYVVFVDEITKQKFDKSELIIFIYLLKFYYLVVYLINRGFTWL